MLESFKPLLSSTLRPISRVLAGIGVHPNHLTLIGVAIFGVAGWCAYTGQWALSAALGLVGGSMDALDGLVAREHGKVSVFGGVLDSVCDRLTEILWVGGLLAWFLVIDSPVRFWGVMGALAVITGSNLVSYVKARAEAVGVECKKGLMQRPERIVSGFILLLTNQTILLWGLGILAILAYGTALQRLIIVYRIVGAKERDQRS